MADATILEAELRAVFNEFDTDKSGQIDAKELVDVLKKVYAGKKSDDDIKSLAGVRLLSFTWWFK